MSTDTLTYIKVMARVPSARVMQGWPNSPIYALTSHATYAGIMCIWCVCVPSCTYVLCMLVCTLCRTGKCEQARLGRCRYAHDPSKVAVCVRWLQSKCTDQHCPLQHRRCPSIMPHCTYYLKACLSACKYACKYAYISMYMDHVARVHVSVC